MEEGHYHKARGKKNKSTDFPSAPQALLDAEESPATIQPSLCRMITKTFDNMLPGSREYRAKGHELSCFLGGKESCVAEGEFLQEPCTSEADH